MSGILEERERVAVAISDHQTPRSGVLGLLYEGKPGVAQPPLLVVASRSESTATPPLGHAGTCLRAARGRAHTSR